MTAKPPALYIAANKFHLWLGSSPFGDETYGLYLFAQCLDGPHDGSAIPLALNRENAAKMWPVLKQYAEANQ